MKNKAIVALAVFAVVLTACPAWAILGDVNGDGRVDMKDIAIVAKAFGARPSDPRWNPIADLNTDGLISMLDVAIVASKLGA